MTIAPVSFSSSLVGEKNLLDEMLCKAICEKNLQSFFNFLDQGLNPNYCLREEVILNGITFQKGTSLIFVLIKSCVTCSGSSWNDYIIFSYMLEKGVDLTTQIEFEKEMISPLECICKNEEHILQDAVLLVLKSVPVSSAITAMQKITNKDRSNVLLRELFPGMVFSTKNLNRRNR